MNGDKDKLQRERNRLNLILHISGVVFIMISLYYLLGLWDLKSINEPFVKGLASFGVSILCFYIPHSCSKCKQCNEDNRSDI